MVPHAAPRISVVVPMLNEERNVQALVKRLFRVLEGIGEPFEVICVNDGSTDATERLLEEEARARPELRAVQLARNFGQHAAIIAGFDASRGSWVVTIDADLQNPPEEIPRIVEELRRGHDLVGTYREGRQDPALRKAASFLVNRLVRAVSRIEIRDFGCMLRGYSGDVARAVARRSGSQVFIPALATVHAASPVEIPVSHAPRAAGSSKYSLRTLAGLALDLLVCIPIRPVRLLFICGASLALASLGLGLALVVLRLSMGSTWQGEMALAILAALVFALGVQLVAFGLLGERLGRTHAGERALPPYILKQAATTEPAELTPAASQRPGVLGSSQGSRW